MDLDSLSGGFATSIASLMVSKLLRMLPPEIAHAIAISALKRWQVLPRAKRPAAPAIRIPALPTLRFRNRLGLAAGFDKNAEAFAGLSRLGFGFIEVGTVTPLPQKGNPQPRIWRLPEEGLVNFMGFNNVGLERFAKSIERLKPLIDGTPIFANIGKGRETPLESAPEDYAKSFQRLAPLVDGFVVNVSSPNTAGLRDLQSERFIESIERVAPSMPIWIKFAPDLADGDLTTLCRQVGASSKFTGVVVVNTSRALAAPRDVGGYSGPKLFDRAVTCVALARQALPPAKMVIGVGGVTTKERASAMRKAGADLVEIYTGFIMQGPRLVRRLASALRD